MAVRALTVFAELDLPLLIDAVLDVLAETD